MQFIAAILAGAAVATASYAPPPKDSYEAPKAPEYETPAPPAYAPPAYTTPAANTSSVYYEKPSYVTEVVTEYTTYCPGMRFDSRLAASWLT